MARAAQYPDWKQALASHRKDGRYFETLEDGILPAFDYGCFVLPPPSGGRTLFQPFFALDLDMTSGSGARTQALLARVRRFFPRALKSRALMIGCSAGEGHLDGTREEQLGWAVPRLAHAASGYAREIGASLVVFKEFPASSREVLAPLVEAGFVRVPSLPMVQAPIGPDSFEGYTSRTLSRATRRDLSRKFRDAKRAGKFEFDVVHDITPWIDEVYPLYEQVFARAELRFEKLTAEFLCRLGRDMPDKARFFIWRLNGRPVAFSLCMVHGDTLYDEYLGMDYSVALDAHLYFLTLRDIWEWARVAGYRRYCSNGSSYEPKLHLGFELVPLDLYVRHESPVVNRLLKRLLPVLEPTHRDPTLRKFRNFASLWRDE